MWRGWNLKKIKTAFTEGLATKAIAGRVEEERRKMFLHKRLPLWKEDNAKVKLQVGWPPEVQLLAVSWLLLHQPRLALSSLWLLHQMLLLGMILLLIGSSFQLSSLQCSPLHDGVRVHHQHRQVLKHWNKCLPSHEAGLIGSYVFFLPVHHVQPANQPPNQQIKEIVILLFLYTCEIWLNIMEETKYFGEIKQAFQKHIRRRIEGCQLAAVFSQQGLVMPGWQH